MWVDTHCHWDAPELAPTALARRTLARERGVALSVVPAVSAATWASARDWAHHNGDVYALGIHPMCVADAQKEDLERLSQALREHRDDPRLVAVGEVGLDGFAPNQSSGAAWDRQWRFYVAQLKLAKQFDLPVVLHVRSAVDWVLKGLRQVGIDHGIAHAFNGSFAQALAMADRGMMMGFGGACTFDGAKRLRALAQKLPAEQLVMETDGPDIPPQWLYVPKYLREQGQAQGLNASDELPAIARVIAELRGIRVAEWAQQTTENAVRALPRLHPWMNHVNS